MKIKEIPAENRPRERLKKFGASALSDAELLAIILQNGVKGENVVDMCNRLISFYGIGNLSDLSFEELHKVYFFSWDDVPGNDSGILLKYMEDDLKMDWAKNAEISKEDDGETIIIKNGENSFTFKFDKAKKYLFSWDDVPENNIGLVKFLKDDLKIEWVENAEIKKNDNNETITVAKGTNTIFLKLHLTSFGDFQGKPENNKTKKMVSLELNGVKKYKYLLKEEEGKLNIYAKKNVTLVTCDDTHKYILKKENGKIKVYHKINGIGEAKAMQIKALFEFNKRCNLAAKSLKKIKYAKEVFGYASQKIPDNKKEYFMVILLDSKNRIIADKIVSIGILNASLIHPREVFRDAIKDGANAIVLVHNHPSDDPTPSTDDIKITETLVKTGEIIGISVIDHVIIGDTYYSFKENGKI